MAESFETSFDILKVDKKLGIVFGWGIISTKRAADEDARVPYFDLQDDHIPAESMLKAVTDFHQNSRAADEMHDGEQDGTVVFGFPLTAEIMKVFGIECDTEGWMVAVKPSAEVLGKFEDGTYTGFSIGGKRVTDVAEEALAS